MTTLTTSKVKPTSTNFKLNPLLSALRARGTLFGLSLRQRHRRPFGGSFLPGSGFGPKTIYVFKGFNVFQGVLNGFQGVFNGFLREHE